MAVPSLYHWLPTDALEVSVMVSVFVPLEVIVGLEGIALTVTANDRTKDVPHALFAVTDMFPPVALAVAVIEVVVDAPVQPLGNVHV